VPLISDYGASEAPGIAEECASGRLHVSIDCYKVEVVNAHGEVLPEGTIGDLVITSLHNRTMPLIRYRIGDVGRLVPGQCECGSPFPQMELVVGKSVDLITTSYADKVSAHYLDYINIDLMKRGLYGIEQFKLYQHNRDEFELHVVHGKGDLNKSAAEFLVLLRDRLGPVDVTLEVLGEIPLEATGKHRYFVNKCVR
jgi:phenylacetate-CoA ligase